MNGLSSQTRMLLKSLRDAETLSPSDVDFAWHRFKRRHTGRQRTFVGVGLGFGLVAAGAIALVMLVPAWRTAVVGVDPGSGYSEAIDQVDGRRVEGMAKPRRPHEVVHSTELVPSVGSVRESPRNEISSSVDPTSHSSSTARHPPVRLPRSPTRVRRPEPSKSPDTSSTSLDSDDAKASTLAAELSLLNAAEFALREGDLKRVETLLYDHRTRFSTGALVNERRKLEQALLDRREENSLVQD